MVAINDALAAHLAGDVTTLCHCWRLTRGDGVVLGFTDHDRRLLCDGTVFQPETGLMGSEARSSLGLAVDTVDVEGALSALDIRDGDIEAGLYDGAKVETLLVNWRAPAEFALLRSAIIGKMTRRDGSFVAELESEAWALDQPNGRTVRRHCDAELGDARCGFDPHQPGFYAQGTVVAVDAIGGLSVAGLEAFEGGWFSGGRLDWNAGENAGRQERVSEHRKDAEGARLFLWRETPVSVGVGDAFTVFAGCDKQFSTCKEKFDNALNFQGFPHLPGDDAAYGYVAEGSVFDGEALIK